MRLIQTIKQFFGSLRRAIFYEQKCKHENGVKTLSGKIVCPDCKYDSEEVN